MKTIDTRTVVATIEGYADIWPITQEHVFYRLVKDGVVENTSQAFEAVTKIAIDYTERVESYLRPFVAGGYNTAYWSHKMFKHRQPSIWPGLMDKAHDIPDVMDAPRHIEVWTDDPGLTNFVIMHARRDVVFEVHHVSGLLCCHNCMAETKGRLGSKDSYEVNVVLYLGGLDKGSLALYKDICSAFQSDVAFFDRIGLNMDHVAGMVQMPDYVNGIDPNEEEAFRKEFGLSGSYSPLALEPAELIGLVDSSIERHLEGQPPRPTGVHAPW